MKHPLLPLLAGVALCKREMQLRKGEVKGQHGRKGEHQGRGRPPMSMSGGKNRQLTCHSLLNDLQATTNRLNPGVFLGLSAMH